MKKLIKRVKRRLWRYSVKFLQQVAPRKFLNVSDLCFWHFLLRSQLRHQNRDGLTLALLALNRKPGLILETGTSCRGTDSTRLWATYVNQYGGKLWSVDIDEVPRSKLGNLGPQVELVVEDSVSFIRMFQLKENEAINFLYLDSYDIDWADPLPAAKHGYQEFQASKKFLSKGSVVVVDDTPATINWIYEQHHPVALGFKEKFGTLPGKGALIVNEVKENPEKYEILYHDYNFVFKLRG